MEKYTVSVHGGKWERVRISWQGSGIVLGSLDATFIYCVTLH
jgi:hypothetical protein